MGSERGEGQGVFLFDTDRANTTATSRQFEQRSVLTWPDTRVSQSKVGVRVTHRSINFCTTTKIQTVGMRYRWGRIIVEVLR